MAVALKIFPRQTVNFKVGIDKISININCILNLFIRVGSM